MCFAIRSKQRPATHRAGQQLAQVRRDAAVTDVQQQAGVAAGCCSVGAGGGRSSLLAAGVKAELQEGHRARRHPRLVQHAPLNVQPHRCHAGLQQLVA